MRAIRYATLAFLLTACPLLGGKNRPIQPGDKHSLALGLNVQAVRNGDTMQITVKVRNKYHGKSDQPIGDIRLVDSKWKSLKTEMKLETVNDLKVIRFSLKTNQMSRAHLLFSYPNGSRCPPAYDIDLNAFVKPGVGKDS